MTVFEMAREQLLWWPSFGRKKTGNFIHYTAIQSCRCFLMKKRGRRQSAFFASYPPIKNMVRIRTRYLDDRLDHQLQVGYQQVVILLVGLDTRAIRKPAQSVAYFEIDDENILAFKEC